MGGLGNQLFQLSFLYFCREQSPQSYFTLSTAWYQTQKNLLDHEVPKLHLLFNDLSYDDRVTLVDSLFLRCKYIRGIVRHSSFLARLSSICFESKLLSLLPYSEVINDHTTFLGFWQNKIFANYLKATNPFPRHKVRGYLSNLEYASKLFQQSAAYPCLSVHIRRGDYLSRPQHDSSPYKVLDKSYYLSAFKRIFTIAPSPLNIFFFSDDDAWIRENFSSLVPSSMHEHLATCQFASDFCSNEVDEFFLMLFCQYHIVSNSSFSWWPAFFNFNGSDVNSVLPPSCPKSLSF